MTSKKKPSTNLDDLYDDVDFMDMELLDEDLSYMRCPRCGSDTWSHLHTTKHGEPNFCNECKGYEKH